MPLNLNNPVIEHRFTIWDGLMSGVGYLAISIDAFRHLFSPKKGHRFLLWLTGVFFALRSGANFFSAWGSYHHRSRVAALAVYSIGGALGMLYGAYILASHNDIGDTLLATGAKDSADRRKFLEFAQKSIEVVNDYSVSKSAALVEMQRKDIEGHD